MDITQIHQLFLNSTGICTDTRKLQKGQLFVALKGEHFDGNKYALSAIENGASYSIVDNNLTNHPKVITVTNALYTLQELAKFHRNYLNIPIIALTGSNGKTTTKELILSVLNTQYNCTATKGNFNNHIGVPLTLLSMDKNTEIGVVEMGANHLKEIAELAEIANPNYGYITNIGKAHLEGFGSEENILIGKTELYEYIKKNKGILFCNSDDPKLTPLAKTIDNSIFFSKNTPNTIQIELKDISPYVNIKFESHCINSKLIGSYNYTNIAASIAIGSHFNISNENIKLAIENYIPDNNRSELITKNSNDIILDAYNANPSSMEEALNNFTTTKTNKNNRSVILGDMFELGRFALEEHQKIVTQISNSNIDNIYLSGNHFFECKINSKKISVFKDTKSLILHLQKNPITNSLILIKGSRGMRLENTLDTFQ